VEHVNLQLKCTAGMRTVVDWKHIVSVVGDTRKVNWKYCGRGLLFEASVNQNHKNG